MAPYNGKEEADDNRQEEALPAQITEFYDLTKPCFLKTIRADGKDFFLKFIETVTISRITITDKARTKYALRLYGEKEAYTVLRDGVYKRADKNPETYYGADTSYYSKPQSTTYIDPQSNFLTDLFGHGNRKVLVGVRFDPKDVHANRIKKYDQGTVRRQFEFDNYDEALAFYESQVSQGIWHPDVDSLVEHVIKTEPKMANGLYPYNEVLAKLRWNCDGSSQICIFTNNLMSRLLAQERAQQLLVRLKAQAKEDGIPLPDNYEVPISFYLPAEQGELCYYTPAEQAIDCIIAYEKGLLKIDEAINEQNLTKLKSVSKETLHQLFKTKQSKVYSLLEYLQGLGLTPAQYKRWIIKPYELKIFDEPLYRDANKILVQNSNRELRQVLEQLLSDSQLETQLKTDSVALLNNEQKFSGLYLLTFADSQSTKKIKTLLGFLKFFIEKEDITSSLLIDLLKRQNNYGCSLGLIIARHGSAETYRVYLDLLKTLLEKDDMTSSEFIDLLKLPWTLEYSIAKKYPAVIQAYLDLLKTLLEKNDMFSNEIIDLLKRQNDDGWSLGLIIARHGSAETCRAYLDLLKTLLEKDNMTAREFIKLFMLQMNSWTLGHSIAKKCPTVTPAYLDLLKTLCDKKYMSSWALIDLLKRNNNEGWSLDALIVSYGSEKTRQAYLDLLKTQSEKNDMTFYLLLNFLKRQNNYGYTLGHRILKSYSKGTSQAYLDLLKTLCEKDDLTSSAFIDLLICKDIFENSLTLGQLIARSAEKSKSKTYENILHILLQREDCNLQDIFVFRPILISSHTNKETNKSIIKKLSADIEHLDKDIYEEIAPLKSSLKQSLLKFGNQTVLANAINPKHPLGQLFWTQRGTRKPSLQRGCLADLNQQYRRLCDINHSSAAANSSDDLDDPVTHTRTLDTSAFSEHIHSSEWKKKGVGFMFFSKTPQGIIEMKRALSTPSSDWDPQKTLRILKHIVERNGTSLFRHRDTKLLYEKIKASETMDQLTDAINGNVPAKNNI